MEVAIPHGKSADPYSEKCWTGADGTFVECATTVRAKEPAAVAAAYIAELVISTTRQTVIPFEFAATCLAGIVAVCFVCHLFITLRVLWPLPLAYSPVEADQERCDAMCFIFCCLAGSVPFSASIAQELLYWAHVVFNCHALIQRGLWRVLH